MVSSPGLYFVIAGKDQARLVRPDPDNGLHTVGLVTAHATEPQGSLASDQTSLAPMLARRIREDLAADVFTDLVLIAPSPLLQALTGSLDAPTTASLVGTLARDLMTVPDLELWPHLLPWIQPTELECAPIEPCREG